MTTLAANVTLPQEQGNRNDIPVIASDIIYQGAAVGVVPATGHARPLAAGDRFVGFAEAKADNSAGAAAAINVRVIDSGEVQLSVTGAVITDIGQPVYATDDAAFGFVPTSAVFIGFVKRFVSSGVAVVAFDANRFVDPHDNRTVRATHAASATLAAVDSGRLLSCATDAVILTLPAIADGLGGVKIMNTAAYGVSGIKIAPAALDMILGPGITGADAKFIINTKATAKRGDYVVLDLGDADGYVITEMVGIWAREA